MTLVVLWGANGSAPPDDRPDFRTWDFDCLGSLTSASLSNEKTLVNKIFGGVGSLRHWHNQVLFDHGAPLYRSVDVEGALANATSDLGLVD